MGISDEQLETLLKDKKKDNDELTKEQKEENVIEWCSFY